jgi:isopentenyl-diphosphate Delta-isomerase
MEHVIIVNSHDEALGVREKWDAHAAGVLHRALSVFVFDDRGRMLLQRRARGKYHSGGLWSNTCCSHPRPGEATHVAAHRRLGEEMGIACDLEPAFSFVYRADVGNGLVEHEYDHIFVGRCSADPAPDPEEVSAWRWARPAELLLELADRPSRFTPWFRIGFEELRARGYLHRDVRTRHAERQHGHHEP